MYLLTIVLKVFAGIIAACMLGIGLVIVFKLIGHSRRNKVAMRRDELSAKQPPAIETFDEFAYHAPVKSTRKKTWDEQALDKVFSEN